MSRYWWAGILMGVAAVCAAVSWYVTDATQTLTANLERAADEQAESVTTLISLSARNLVTSEIDRVVTSCDEEQKQTFEALLNQLATLSQAELTTLQTLFDACARDNAARRTAMAYALATAYQHLATLVEALEPIRPQQSLQYPLETWGTIVERERERAALLRELVALQGSIIADLRTDADAPANVPVYIDRATEIQDRTIAINAELRSLRASLPSL